MANLPRRPSVRVFWNSAKLRPGKALAKRRPQKTHWRKCHHLLIKMHLKCQHSTTFCCKPRLPKCPQSRAIANLPRRPAALVFWNSTKLRPGEFPAKRRPQKRPCLKCHHLLIKMHLKCQHSTTFCWKPRLPKCPQTRAMANLPRRPWARVFWNSAKLRPEEAPAKRRPQKTPWRKCHHLLIKMHLKCQHSTTFCCKPRLPKCPQSRAMANLPRRPSARVFWNSTKLRPGETPAKRRPQKTPWRKCHHLLIRMHLKCQHSTTFCCKPRLPKCPQSRAMANLPRRPSARVFWNSTKLRPGETPAKRRPQKTPWRKCRYLLIKMSLKSQHSTTFCCKPRLPKCPQSRAMANLPRRPSARVFWNSAKLRPEEAPAKRRPQKTPWRKCHHLLIRMHLKCQHSTTFCCKPRLPKCSQSRAMANLPRRPSARVFWNSTKLRPGEFPAKRRPQKTPCLKCHHLLIKMHLKCQHSTTFCCKPRLPKCPQTRAMANLARRPSARVFWNSAKLQPGETPAKRRPQKKAPAQMPSSPSYNTLKLPT